MNKKGQFIKIAVLMLLLVTMVCGMGARDETLWMNWLSQIACSLYLIVPGLAIIIGYPFIAQLWFSNPGGFRRYLLGNSSWEELSLLKKVAVYVSAIIGLVLGGIMLYGVVSEILLSW